MNRKKKYFSKSILGLTLAATMLLSSSIVALADLYSPVDGGQGPGNAISTGGIEQRGDTIGVDVGRVGSSHRYWGEGNRRNDGTNYYNNPRNTGGISMTDACLAAGATQAQVDAFMAANGYTQDSQGWWRRPDGGLVDQVKLNDLMEIPAEGPEEAVDPAQVNPPGQPPRPPAGWVIHIDENRITLMSGEGYADGIAVNEDVGGKEYYKGEEYGVSMAPFSFSLPGGSPQAIFEASGRTMSMPAQNEIEWTSVNTNYSGLWCEVNHKQFKKWHEPWDEEGEEHTREDGTTYHDTIHHEGYWEYSPDYYTIVGWPSASGGGSHDYGRLRPEYIEKLPVSLTTEEGYSGGVSIVDTHNWDCKSGDGPSGVVNVTVKKKNIPKGEMLTLIANNNPVEFTVDFNDTWFGVGPENNLLGGVGITNGYAQGFQWCNFAQLYYGPDYQSDSRSPKIASLTEYQTTDAEVTGSQTYRISEGTAVPWTVYLRNIKENNPGEPYLMGESGNNCWWTVLRLDRNNLKGHTWGATWEASPGISNYESGLDDQYLIFDYFKQPVLYGEYDSKNAAGTRG